QLGFGAGLSAKTMSRLFSRDIPVDRRTIELLFAELGLKLEPDDVSPPAARVLAERAEVPHYRTVLFGREKELARLGELAHERMVVTLTGPGGVGKTRLAVEWMRRTVLSYSHIAFLDLSLLTDGATLRDAIGAVLDDVAADGDDVLIVLDGCEHLIEAAAIAVSALLDEMPQLSVLATSREPLGVAGEAVLRLAPLAVPDAAAELRPAEALGFSAFAMFVERARSFDDGFTLGEEAVPVVAEIVRRLDGVPLALELAAARAAFMTLPDLLTSLRDHLEALSEGARAGVPRHRSARALIDWSYELLTQQEREVFQCLAAFMGTFSAAAVAAVCEGHPPARALGEILAGLVRKSLLVVDAAGPATRFRMLETIRQYAAAKLAESGDAAGVKQRHALYFYEVAAGAANPSGPSKQEFARRELELEIPNLRESLDWSTSASRNMYLGAAIAAQLVEFWTGRGDFVEAEHWLRRTLESESELLTAEVLAKLHEGLALVTYRRGRVAEAVDEASKALSIYASIDDVAGKLRARDLLGLAAMDGGEIEAARDQFESTLREARATNDPRAISASLNNLGRLSCEHEGQFDVAMPLFAESLATARANGLVSQAISALTNLSECALALGHYGAGLTYARLGIADAEKLGNREATADLALQAVAHILRSGGFAAVRDDAMFAWEAIADVPYRPPISARLDDVALALHAAGEPRRAAILLGASDAFRRRGEVLGSVRAGERRRVARVEIGEILSPGEAEALNTRGASLSLRDAFREALIED
ncbi:MAG: hypothetical protein M3169_10645, partial [Candidatus Eremiobacteraeota bacterium]|nr:hypothetical protein [Candidatus Eremiobacteraeota bacterium]